MRHFSYQYLDFSIREMELDNYRKFGKIAIRLHPQITAPPAGLAAFRAALTAAGESITGASWDAFKNQDKKQIPPGAAGVPVCPAARLLCLL